MDSKGTEIKNEIFGKRKRKIPTEPVIGLTIKPIKENVSPNPVQSDPNPLSRYTCSFPSSNMTPENTQEQPTSSSNYTSSIISSTVGSNPTSSNVEFKHEEDHDISNLPVSEFEKIAFSPDLIISESTKYSESDPLARDPEENFPKLNITLESCKRPTSSKTLTYESERHSTSSHPTSYELGKDSFLHVPSTPESEMTPSPFNLASDESNHNVSVSDIPLMSPDNTKEENQRFYDDEYDKDEENSETTMRISIKIEENHDEVCDIEDEINYDLEPPLSRIVRRKSVFAEAYNPEDEEDESERIIHAKSDHQRNRLGDNIKNIFLFRSLENDQIGEVLDAMFERKVTEGEYVIKQGDDGDNFYVIESGIYNIYVDIDPTQPSKLVGKYENSGSFGELALMYNLPRAATIQAVSTGSLWAMDRQTFRRIVLTAAYKKRKMYESLLEKVPMLKTLQNYERMNLADALIPRIKSDGELIIKQGDAADGMYFVEAGSARVVMVNSDKEAKEISRVNVGGYFGELALVTKKARAASVYAVGQVRLAFLDVEAFERLLGPCMNLMKRNIEDYENELLRIFGSKANISDIR